MDIEQARTFLAIAAHGSFLEAAGRLHVTQSTVSARIQHLEADLGARLPVSRYHSHRRTNRLMGGISASLGRLDARCRC